MDLSVFGWNTSIVFVKSGIKYIRLRPLDVSIYNRLMWQYCHELLDEEEWTTLWLDQIGFIKDMPKTQKGDLNSQTICVKPQCIHRMPYLTHRMHP